MTRGRRSGWRSTCSCSSTTRAEADGRTLVACVQSKTDKVQAFLLPEAGAEIAGRYLATDGPDSGPTTGLLFPLCRPGELADPIRRRREIGRANARINKALNLAAEAAKVPPFSTHAARHSWASGKVTAGGDLRPIQRALGHSTLAMTSRYVAGLGGDVLDLDSI